MPRNNLKLDPQYKIIRGSVVAFMHKSRVVQSFCNAVERKKICLDFPLFSIPGKIMPRMKRITENDLDVFPLGSAEKWQLKTFEIFIKTRVSLDKRKDDI